MASSQPSSSMKENIMVMINGIADQTSNPGLNSAVHLGELRV